MERKVYNPKFIGAGATLAGPLVGAYMMAHNFNVFGQRRQAIWTWVISSIVLAGLFSAGYLLDGVSSTMFLPFIVGFAMLTTSNKMQGEKINEHLAQGGLSYSPWRAVIITVIGIAMIILPVYTYIMFSDSYQTKSYTELGHIVVYNSDNISVSDADCFAEYLIDIEYFDNDYQGFVALDKSDGVYEISMPVTIEVKDNQEIYDSYIELLRDMRNTLSGKRICMLLCLNGEPDNVIKRIE